MNKKKFVLILLVFLFFLIPIIFFIKTNDQKNGIEEKIINYVVSVAPVEKTKRESKLNEIFLNNFGNDPNYAVFIKNFETGEEFNFQETKEYNSASLYKLWVLAVVMQKINENVKVETEIKTATITYLDNSEENNVLIKKTFTYDSS